MGVRKGPDFKLADAKLVMLGDDALHISPWHEIIAETEVRNTVLNAVSGVFRPLWSPSGHCCVMIARRGPAEQILRLILLLLTCMRCLLVSLRLNLRCHPVERAIDDEISIAKHHLVDVHPLVVRHAFLRVEA